jgi:hypothetical protein
MAQLQQYAIVKQEASSRVQGIKMMSSDEMDKAEQMEKTIKETVDESEKQEENTDESEKQVENTDESVTKDLEEEAINVVA